MDFVFFKRISGRCHATCLWGRKPGAGAVVEFACLEAGLDRASDRSERVAGNSERVAKQSEHVAGNSEHVAEQSERAAGNSEHAAEQSERAAGQS